ncbi:hypothetical protein ACFYZ5_42440 [Streptomyces chartreusis]|uniref:hypothetical protein n=1 Tax=Streptomyces chartreusis TaxID=1969 RepID=UPI0036CA6FA0
MREAQTASVPPGHEALSEGEPGAHGRAARGTGRPDVRLAIASTGRQAGVTTSVPTSRWSLPSGAAVPTVPFGRAPLPRGELVARA